MQSGLEQPPQLQQPRGLQSAPLMLHHDWPTLSGDEPQALPLLLQVALVCLALHELAEGC